MFFKKKEKNETATPQGKKKQYFGVQVTGWFAVSPSKEESDDLPNWHIERSWGTTNSHSETLNIYCPKGARVEAIDRIEATS